MSLDKEKLSKIEEYENIAKEILQEMGAIKFCFCGKTYYDTGLYDRQNIFGLATTKLKEKYGDKQDFPLFDEVLDRIFSDCPFGVSCKCSDSD